MPSKSPSDLPSIYPTDMPSKKPSHLPSIILSELPSSGPSDLPSHKSSALPSNVASSSPSNAPSHQPLIFSSESPSNNPSVVPSSIPTNQPNENPTLFPTQAFTTSSVTTKYQQESVGSDELSLLNETVIAAYEANMENQAVNNTSITNVQVSVTSQEITTIDNGRRLQDQNYPKMLTVTYDLTIVHHKIDEINSFFQSHVYNMMQQKNEIKSFMSNLGIKVEEVITTVEVTLAPSASFLASRTISMKPSNFPSLSRELTNSPSTALPSSKPTASKSLKTPKNKKKSKKGKKPKKKKKKKAKNKTSSKNKKKPKMKKKKSKKKTERPRRNRHPSFFER